MDFELDPQQQEVLDAVERLAVHHAGPARAMALAAKGEIDGRLDAALREAGFDGLARGEETGPLEAVLMIAKLARHAACLPLGASLLVAPMLVGEAVGVPVALCERGDSAPVRFAAQAGLLLVLDGDEAARVSPAPDDVLPVSSGFGYPLARVRGEALEQAEALGAGTGERLLAWWRVALAAEILGNLEGALQHTVSYLSQREQFGRPIGSFQAVQHRLADCAVRVEGTRWLVLETASRGAPAEQAALTAGHACVAAGEVHRETHQLSGAIGYTREHDLHVWSMRLAALRLELGGARRHLRDAARLHWKT